MLFIIQTHKMFRVLNLKNLSWQQKILDYLFHGYQQVLRVV